MQGVGLTYVGEEDGYSKYSMSGTFSAGTYPYCMYLPGVSFTGGTSYSTQCVLKTNVPNKFNYIGGGINYVNQAMNNSGANSSVLQTDGSNLIRRQGFNYVSTTNQAGYLHSNPVNNTTFNSSTDFIYIKNFQIEQNTHCTPHTSTSRTDTTSLIDLKKTNNIDVGDISFSSTGQPDFDGTDDEINTGITTQLTDFSCVVIFKDGGSASWGRLVDKEYTTGFFISSYFASVGNNYVGAGVREPSSPHGQALQYDDTKYNYFVLTRSGATHTIYLNGSTNKVQKTNGDSSTLSSTEMAIGAWNGSTASQRYTGEIPVVKLYNKELTAAEIEQDFNAYKNRFNI